MAPSNTAILIKPPLHCVLTTGPVKEQTGPTRFALVDYDSDMSSSMGSLKFASKNYTSQQTFTYRKVYALRYKSILNHQWNNGSNTSLLHVRDNSVKQNPSYSIGSTSNPTKFRAD